MKLAWILWLANVMPQPAADQLCLATTVYLEARNQSQLGQRAVAEVALRRLEKGIWGKNLCEVVMAPKQFAPTLISPDYRLANLKAWNRAVGSGDAVTQRLEPALPASQADRARCRPLRGTRHRESRLGAWRAGRHHR
jgi:hypothetical protein